MTPVDSTSYEHGGFSKFEEFIPISIRNIFCSSPQIGDLKESYFRFGNNSIGLRPDCLGWAVLLTGAQCSHNFAAFLAMCFVLFLLS